MKPAIYSKLKDMTLSAFKVASLLIFTIGVILCSMLAFQLPVLDQLYFIDFIPDYVILFLFLPAIIFINKKRLYLFLTGCVFFVMSSSFQVNIANNLSEEDGIINHRFKVASFNVAQRVNAEKLYQFFEQKNLDVLFVQEGSYDMFKDSAQYNLYGECVKRLCVLSKYALTQLESLNRRALGGWGQYVSLHKINVGGNGVLLANVHFASISNFGYRFNTFAGFLSKISLFKDTKAIEFGLVKALIEKWSDDEAIVIAGDFNLTDRNQQFTKYWGDFRNAFNESGFGYGTTRKSWFLSPRIDHILSSKRLSPVATSVWHDMESDHYPVVSTLQFIGRTE